ncbi:hypothetical protein BSL78_17372 [Apostichopus japonicus]|uniref:GHMP kinase N-terminal domain-containing protein n=1 Tax=Stichopus japonicus TaxID=307972 RepID=A0A2G8KCN6_STIJA|nr:hypothetical protein BSL78_17372 [Apostichopus japonicus]
MNLTGAGACRFLTQHSASVALIALPKRNFTLKYDTNIPRQVGLAGSSAIVTATMQCLMHFFDITDLDMKKPLQPQFILDVEMEELFINAGLQDRVIQVYEGLVYMDFSTEIFKAQGHGDYEPLDMSLLPSMWLAYIRDSEVMEAMKTFAQLTDQARQALETKDHNKLRELMDRNFDLRRKLYGDDVIGAENLQMVNLARQHGSCAKFPGSGGAVIGFCPDADNLKHLKKAFQSEGFVFCDVSPNPPQVKTRKNSQLS